ncbi:hypothetical protein WKU26_12260 [Phocaeicola sp. HCN-40430]|uniref:hypothetical protein n=1 Tax=Phocaeicola sp. HCN-40430 TaxID=3134664 RepID=UPI0030C59CE2
MRYPGDGACGCSGDEAQLSFCLEEGERVLCRPAGSSHGLAVQECHEDVGHLSRPGCVVPSRCRSFSRVRLCRGICRRRMQGGDGTDGGTGGAASGGRGRGTLRGAPPQRLHLPLSVLDEPLRGKEAGGRKVGAACLCRLRGGGTFGGGNRAELLCTDCRTCYLPAGGLSSCPAEPGTAAAQPCQCGGNGKLPQRACGTADEHPDSPAGVPVQKAGKCAVGVSYR